MAGRPKEPIGLLVAKGKKHLSQAEIYKREDSEIKVPFNDVKPPKYLTTKKAQAEFQHYADMLVQLDIFTELDVDMLAKYVIAHELYLKYTKQVQALLRKSSVVHKWAAVDKLATLCDKDESLEELKKLLEKIIRRQRGEDISTVMALQDKAFKQCVTCAKELGLTITSRCKLVIPTVNDEEDDPL